MELRIDALEAAVAAGLIPPAPAPTERTPDADRDLTAAYELPDWADPPTGQVPRVLLDDPDQFDINEPLLRKPTWRDQRDERKEHEFDLSMLADEVDDAGSGEIAGQVLPGEAPFGFAALDEPVTLEESAETDDDESAWVDLFDQPAPERRRHAAHRANRGRRTARARGGDRDLDTSLPPPDTVVQPTPPARRRAAVKNVAPRNALVATATGLGLGLVAILCLLGGPAPTDGMIAALGTVAAGEFYGVLQKGGYRPATLIGLGAVPACIVSAYIDGPSAIAVVIALAFVASGGWFLRRAASDEPIVDAAVTLFVVCWVGVLGGFASLLLAPSAHPSGHGIALVFGVIACTVGHDIGSYAIGSKLGKHKIAPRISPGKTVEGLIGGTVCDLVVALAVVSRFHPLTMGTAALLGVAVAVVAPLGDLIESAVKRDLGVKDMGSILPGHGGVFDRIDAMLVVMPVAYLLFRIANVA